MKIDFARYEDGDVDLTLLPETKDERLILGLLTYRTVDGLGFSDNEDEFTIRFLEPK